MSTLYVLSRRPWRFNQRTRLRTFCSPAPVALWFTQLLSVATSKNAAEKEERKNKSTVRIKWQYSQSYRSRILERCSPKPNLRSGGSFTLESKVPTCVPEGTQQCGKSVLECECGVGRYTRTTRSYSSVCQLTPGDLPPSFCFRSRGS